MYRNERNEVIKKERGREKSDETCMNTYFTVIGQISKMIMNAINAKHIHTRTQINRNKIVSTSRRYDGLTSLD